MRMYAYIAIAILLAYVPSAPLHAQDRSAKDLMADTLKMELNALRSAEHVSFTAQEKSNRTGQHVWTEKVVSFEEGTIRRLQSIDGQSLSAPQKLAEDRRIEKLLSHPAELKKSQRALQEEDVPLLEKFMQAVTDTLLFSYDGDKGGCAGVRFWPNPSFMPSGYQARIIHSLEGIVYISRQYHRICEVEGHNVVAVQIGYGLIGKLDHGEFHIVWAPTSAGVWEVNSSSVHLAGKAMMVKNISEDSHEIRTEVRDLPAHLTARQAADLTLP